MRIKYFGWQSFRIQEGKEVIVTSPFSREETGILFPKTKADVVLTIPERKGEEKERIGGLNRKTPFWTEGPGEYEASEVEIWGLPGNYWVKVGGVEFIFSWRVDERSLKKISEDLPSVDVLFVRGDQKGEELKKIRKVVEKLSPSVIIPFCFPETTSREELKNGQWAKRFLDVLDKEDVKPEKEVVLKKEALSEEDMKVVLLEPKAI